MIINPYFAMILLLNTIQSYRVITNKLFNHNIIRNSNNFVIKPLNNQNLIKEYIIGSRNNEILNDSLDKYNNLKNNSIEIIKDSSINDKFLYVLSYNNIIIDYIILEQYFLGKHRLSSHDNALKWLNIINQRLYLLYQYESHNTVNNTFEKDIKLGDGGIYQSELDKALLILHRTSYLSKGFQNKIYNTNKFTQDKLDNSPVTIIDFAVQAIIIDYLSIHFPNDRFIAEEDSSMLRINKQLCKDIISVLNSITINDNDKWTEDKLINTIDKGKSNDTDGRVWVLDPIDGTKGFIRNEHYCIALALLINGKPILSTLGCPNLNINNILQYDKPNDIGRIDYSISYTDSNFNTINVPNINSGAIFYAVSGLGAFVRSLSMPLNSAIEVEVSSITNNNEIKLCESVESSYGDRIVTQNISNNLNLKYDFIRLDGQCKSALVGSGSVEGTLRLLPKGYLEKIWDVAPGYHFVSEANGKVTDLQGNDIDFTKGRYLGDIGGIISSNKIIHNKLLDCIKQFKLNN